VAGQQALNILPSEQQEFGRYHLLCRFATGGMANVYLARLTGTQGFEKLVAIKRIHEHLTEDDAFLQMFVDEARLSARISHPNVVQVIELGQVGTTHYIAMEYVEGESLAALMRRARPPIPVAVRIIANAASGLHAAHTLRDASDEPLNVVHRDVSPQNILVSYDGAVKVADFGVARARSNVHTTSLGQVKGKFAYMAPEQIAMDDVDARTDIFALGIVAWEMITGHRLFKAPNDAATVAKVREMEILPPSILAPQCPPPLADIVMTCLQREPDLRFNSIQEMEDALEGVLLDMETTVQQRHVAAMMRSAFADRIDAKRQLMVQCQQTREVIIAPSGVGTDPSASMAGPTMTQGQAELAALRSRRWTFFVSLGAVAVAALVLGGVLVYVGTDPGTPEETPVKLEPNRDIVPQAPAVAAPKQIKILVRVSPAQSTITVDGKQVANPFELERAPSERELKVNIDAPGHVAQQLNVPLSQSGRWEISLVPTPVEPRPGRHHKKKGHRHKLDDDLFGDPYGK